MTILQRNIQKLSYPLPFLFCLLGLCFTIVSCKKDAASIIGEGLQPEDEWIYAVYDDTTAWLNLVAYSVRDDSAATSGKSLLALGSYCHRDFGTLSANIITQIYEYSIYDSVISCVRIDSVVLDLVYSNAYPFSEDLPMQPMTISIGELSDAVLLDTESLEAVYYSSENRAHSEGSIMPALTFTPNLRDSVIDPDDSTAMKHNPIIRFHLNETYGRKLINASLNGLAYSENDFLEEIKGIYIKAYPETTPGGGQVVNFDFNSDYGTPTITVYYQKNEPEPEADTISDEKHYVLGFLGSMTYNYYEIDRSTGSNSEDLVQQHAGDTARGQQNLYLQSFFSSLVRMEMPDIQKFANIVEGRNIVINQASLVLNVQPYDRFTPPSSLGIGYLKTPDSMFSIADHSTVIGGSFNKDKSEYRFYLTRHIQQLLLKQDPEENYPLTIYSSSGSSLPELASFFGPDAIVNNKRGMRLEIVYTVLP